MAHLVQTKTALHQAVSHLERLYHGRVALEWLPIEQVPHADLALRIACDSAITHRRSTCVLCETMSPDQVALHMLCIQGRTVLKEVAFRRLEQSDFTRLSWAAAKIASAPLHFVASASVEIDQLAWDLLELTETHTVEVLVCERRSTENLERWRAELEFLSKMSGVEVHLVAGEVPVADRFTPDLGQRA